MIPQPRDGGARAHLEIADTLSSGDAWQQRITRALELVIAVSSAERCALLAAHRPELDAELLAAGAPSDEPRPALKARLIGLLRAVDVDAQAEDDAAVDGEVALPLIGLDATVGMLLVGRAAGAAPFDEEELRRLAAIAAQLGAYLAMLRLLQEADELNRFKQEMFAVIAHDLKTPLATANANLDFVSSRVDGLDEDTRESLAEARLATARTFRLVENLLDLVRIEGKRIELRRAEIAVGPLLREVLGMRSAQRRRAAISAEIDGDDVIAIADRDLLTRMLENLVDNAMRYTPSGGRIVGRAIASPTHVRIEVGNTGEAIPRELAEMIFDRFAQAKRGGRLNLGLGLYFCRMVAEVHGGSIRVERTADLPVVFVIELPR